MPFAARIAAVALALAGLATSTSASLARSEEDRPPARERASEPPALPASAFDVRVRRPLSAGSLAEAAQATESLAGPQQIARVKAKRGVIVHRRPNRRSRARRVARVTEFGSPRTLAVHEVRGDWLGVASAARTDGRLGWVRRGARGLRLRPAKVTIEVDLSSRRVKLVAGDRVLRRVPVAVGARSTSTPTGRFAVTDKLRGGRFGPYYGCCVLALSGTQPNLPAGWGGGNRLAIHGTDSPGQIGTASSAGCLRGADRPLRVLMRKVPLGTPVRIHK